MDYLRYRGDRYDSPAKNALGILVAGSIGHVFPDTVGTVGRIIDRECVYASQTEDCEETCAKSTRRIHAGACLTAILSTKRSLLCGSALFVLLSAGGVFTKLTTNIYWSPSVKQLTDDTEINHQ